MAGIFAQVWRSWRRSSQPSGPRRRQRRTAGASDSRARLLLEALEERVTPSAWLTADRSNYTAGATAVLDAGGFQPGATVQFQVEHTDGSSQYQAWSVSDGGAGDLDGVSDGHVQTTWTVSPAEPAGTRLSVSAVVTSGDGKQEAAFATFTVGATASPAVVTLDKADYHAGETAVVTGAGFVPGETVNLQVVHSDTLQPAAGANPWSVVAGADGSFNTTWYVNPVDSVGASFTLNATGSAGDSAGASFVDGTELVNNGSFETGNFSGWTQSGNLGFTSVSTLNPHSGNFAARMGPVGADGSLSQNLSTVAGTQYTVSWWLENEGGPTNDFRAVWDGTTIFSATNMGAFDYKQFSFTVTAANNGSTLQFFFRQDPSFLDLDDVSVQGLAGTQTTIVSSANSTTYGQAVTFTATTATFPYPVPAGLPTGTVQFQIDGNNFGSPVALVGGSATSAPISTIGAGSHSVTAVFDGGTSFGGSSASLTQTVGPKHVTGSFTAANKVYDGTTAATVLTSTVNGAITGDDVTLTGAANFSDKNVGTGKTVTLSGAGLGGAAAGNYVLDLPVATTTADITKRPASVTPDDASKTFGEPDPTLTGTLTNFVAADGITATYSRTPGETVAGSPYDITAVLSPDAALSNYDITYNVAAFTILKATPTVTVVGGNFVYDEQAHPATGSVTGVGGANLGTPTFTYSFVDADGNVVVLSGPPVEPGYYTVTASFAGNANYNPASATAAITIAFEVRTLTDLSKALHSGRTIPIKLELTDAAGNNVSSSDIDLTAIRLTLVNADGTQTQVTLQASGNSNPDDLFRYDASLGGYIFNLSTKGLAAGTYNFYWTAEGDPTEHSLSFTLS
jgi:hypothetical protein